MTVRSSLTADGKARPRASKENAAVLTDARVDKEKHYHELVGSRFCQLVVVAVDTGGRWWV